MQRTSAPVNNVQHPRGIRNGVITEKTAILYKNSAEKCKQLDGFPSCQKLHTHKKECFANEIISNCREKIYIWKKKSMKEMQVISNSSRAVGHSHSELLQS